MNKKSQLVLKEKLNNLFKEPEDITIPIEVCGDKLIEELSTYSKEEIDFILNDEYYLTKLISRLNDYPQSMWSGRMMMFFKVAIRTLKEIKKSLNIDYKITPRLLINSLDIENLIEMSNFLEEKNTSEDLRKELKKYLETFPAFTDIKSPISDITKMQHDLLLLQVTEKIEKLEKYFNYRNNFIFNLKELRKYEKISNF